jgi:hypothetical protein
VTDLERCDAELAEIERMGATGRYPAWLVLLGMTDWWIERRLIEREGHRVEGRD